MTTNTPAGALPAVSYVMPVLNEITHVEAAIDSLLFQDYTGAFEVVIALGPSIDGTTELVERLSRVDSRIRVIDNPTGSTPSGLNVAIEAARNPVIVRVDAHSVLPTDYTRIAVETMLRTGAANVGGIMHAEGTTPFEDAVAAAYGSKVGLGGGAHHVGGEEGRAETVYLGVFQRAWLVKVGMFDEDFRRGQDWELNKRLREAGGIVWFTPRLTVTYRPRPNVETLARQFFSTGMWRGDLVRRFFGSNSLKYFAPPALVLGVVFGILFGFLGYFGSIAQAAQGPSLLTQILGACFLFPVFYAVFVVVSAIRVGLRHGASTGAWFLIVLPCIHFAWGTGFILGVLKLTSNIAAHTGR